jgi:hypothetical protein
VELHSEVSHPSQEQFATSQSSFLQSLHLQAVHLSAAQLPAVSHFLSLSQQFLSLSQQSCSAFVCESWVADQTAVHGTITNAATSATINPFDIARSP